MAGYSILIIDDDQVSVAVLEDYLKDFGLAVHSAENGIEGIDVLRSLRPDLVLLDIQMPGQDGFQTIENIKKDPEIAGTPVLFLSAYNRSNLKVKGLELGAEDYITKPFDKAELFARIKAALRRSQRYINRERTLEGNLSDIDLTELLQTMELGKKTAIIHLPDLNGELVIEQGKLVSCRQGRFSGIDAINRIFFLNEGHFMVKFEQPPEDAEKAPMALTHIIMDTVTFIDELNRLTAKLPPLQTRVVVTDDMKRLPGGNFLADKPTLALKYLLVLLDGNLQDIAAELAALHQKEPFQTPVNG